MAKMKQMVKVKPRNDLFKSLGVENVFIDEISIFQSINKVELKCKLKNIKAFSELDIIENNLRKKFGNDVNFDFKASLIEKDLSEEEIKQLIKRIIADLKKASAPASAYLAFFRIEIINNNIYIEIKNKMAKEKLTGTGIDQKIKNRIELLLENAMEVEFVIGDFKSEIKKIDDKFKLENVSPPIISANGSTTKTVDSKSKKKSEDPNVLYGKKIKQDAIKYKEFDDFYPGDFVVLEGKVFNFTSRETSTGKTLIGFNITNFSDSITVKIFLQSKDELELSDGTWIKLKGKKQQDKFSNNEDVVFANAIQKIDVKLRKRMDNAEVKRVELHAHTKMSSMDAVIEVKELINKAAEWGHSAVAITDHGVVHGFPGAYSAAKKAGIKAILGTEGYLVDDEVQMVKNPKNMPIEEETYVVFDIETTGFDPYNDKIIEIGAVKLEGNKIIDRFSSFIDPGIPIPKKITELTSITNDDVSGAPNINTVLMSFKEFFADHTLVAHNANFDVGFITQKFKQMGLELEFSVIDTLQWGRNILKDIKRHNLKAITKHLGISLVGHHRAVNDAEATAEVFLKLISLVLKKNAYKLTEIDEVFDNDIKRASTNHIIILVKNKIGLRNLYELISEAHINYFHRVPRIPKSLLKKHKDGLILGSACEAGEIIRAFLSGKPKEEIKELAKFYDYLEIQPNSNNGFLLDNETLKSVEELNDMNRFICDLGDELGKPVVATGDVHYADPQDYIYRSILLYGKGFKDFDKDNGLYFKTTKEMLEEFSYLGRDKAYEVVVENTNKIADLIENIQPIPDGFYPPKIEGAEDQVREMTFAKAKKIYGDPIPENIQKRLDRELNAIINNGFSVLYLISHKLVKKSLDNGYLVGSRGSVGSSLVAYMMDITEVNALYPHYVCSECNYSEFMEFEGSGVDLEDKNCPKCGKKLTKEGHSIPFEVFMGFHGDKVPDIDLNFSGEYQSKIHRYTEEIFGKENVFKAGTISTLAERNAFGYVRKYVEENEIDMRKAEMERLAKGCENVRKTTGQHPGGMIVVPEGHSIYEFTPVQKPANKINEDSITTHFDYHVMDEQLVKLDILGHDDPTTIKLLQEYTGIDIYTIPLDDPATLSIFSSTDTLGVSADQIGSPIGTFGIPEFGTQFVRQMLIETRPSTFAELVRISGLSHGTDVWLNNAQGYIRQGVAKLGEVISVRDDIMNYLIDSGVEKSTSFKIMEFVRKGKPSKDIEKWDEYAKLMKDHKVKQWYIDSCKKIKYMFPKGHAVAYVMMAMRIAYFKVHHPLAFYAAYLSRKAEDFNSETMLVTIPQIESLRRELSGKMKLDVKEKGEMALFEIIVEMHHRGIELLGVDVYESAAKRFLIEDGKIRVPLIALNGLGESVVENIVIEREGAKFLSYEDLIRRTKASKTVVEKLKECKAIDGLSDTNQKKLF